MEWLKKHKFPVLLNAVLVLLSLVCVFGYVSVSNTLHHIDSAESWEGEGDAEYAYISCFMPVNKKIEESAVYSFEKTVDSKLLEASIDSSGEGKLWNFAYSGNGIVEISTGRGSAKVTATGIGGDFFFFHRPFLRDGNYISGNDLMKDCIVIDKNLAWKLFGAVEVSGMEVLIGGSRFIVSGVIEPEEDFASEKARISDGGLYMSYEKLAEISGAKIDCYEAVIPNPVSGFAKGIAVENFPAEGFETVEVDKRYKAGNIFDVIFSFGKRSMRTDGIIFPEWENAARLTEDYCAMFLAFGMVFAVTPAVFAVILIRKYGKIYGIKCFEIIKEKTEKIIDDHNRKIYERNLSEKNKE